MGLGLYYRGVSGRKHKDAVRCKGALQGKVLHAPCVLRCGVCCVVCVVCCVVCVCVCVCVRKHLGIR